MISLIVKHIQNVTAAVAIVANVAGALVLLALVALTDADVIARGIFHAPFRGIIELVIFSMILIVFLQLPDVVRTNRLTRSDGVLAGLSAHRPRISEVISRIIDAISFVFMALIAWTVWPEFLEAFESCHFFSAPDWGPGPTGNLWADLQAGAGRCDYFGTPGILTAPWWPARLAIAFGVTLAAFIFLQKALFGDPLRAGSQNLDSQGSGA